MKKIILIFGFIVVSCDITENRPIVIYNDTVSDICCFVTSQELKAGIINSKNDICINIRKNEFGDINPVREKWESFVERCENKRIRLYIIHQDSIDKYGWENIYQNNIYNKKYLFTIKDLENINWEITYN